MAKRIAAFPEAIVLAAKDWRQRGVLVELEKERLDRIRNPSKYRGKEI